MSSRALRRLAENPEEDSAPTEPENLFVDNKKSYFSMLNFVPDDPVLLEESVDEQNFPQQRSRKKKRSKKKPSKSPSSPTELHWDEKSAISHASQPDHKDISELLSVQSKNLDASLELSRLFKSNEVPRFHKRSGMNHTKRGLLVPIKSIWPPFIKFGLDMARLPDGSFTVTFSKDYKKFQKAFYETLDSMDLNNLTHILNECPYHIDSLLQLSDGLIRQDSSQMGIDLLERVLHAYQSIFHPQFNPTTGQCWLDYKQQSNRGLFIALFRYASLIGSRGSYRCALDYCKVLLSLDVVGDPLAVLLVIDYYAILAGQLDFIIDFYEQLNPSKNLYLLPNFAFSVALAHYWKSNENEIADLLLQDALIMFPGFLTRLMNHTRIGGVSNLDKSRLFGSEVRNEPPSLGRLLDLYLARTHNLWCSPTLLPWLELNVTAILNSVEVDLVGSNSPDVRLSQYSERRKAFYRDLPRNILRHLVLSDLPEAPPIVPEGLQSAPIYPFDPFPPVDSVNICQPETNRRRTNNSQNSILSSLLLSLFPGYSVEDIVSRNEQEPGTSTSSVGQTIAAATEQLTSRIRRILDLHSPADEQNHGNQDET